ncbi:hypothetical protein ABBQ38_005097 [Trebouxia sp. C0009 RCD-2024]
MTEVTTGHAVTSTSSPVDAMPEIAKPVVQNRFIKGLVTSGISVSVANVATMPMDVTKVRMQLQAIRMADGTKPPGLLQTGVNIVKNEGFLALYSGLGPAIGRGLFYGGVRLGCYGPVKEAMGVTSDNPSLVRKIAAGSISGGVAAGVTNPLDLIKTRMQSKANPHKTMIASTRAVLAEGGVKGLWRGSGPSMARAAVLTASQCATYDEIKQAIMRLTGLGDHFGTHLSASMVTGLVTTTATAPVDVIKTHMFVGGNNYTGPLQCAQDIIRREGARGLLRGWTAQYVRLGPQTTVIFVVMEELRKMSGLGSL